MHFFVLQQRLNNITPSWQCREREEMAIRLSYRRWKMAVAVPVPDRRLVLIGRVHR